MAIVDTANLVSITDASKAGVSALVRAAEEGHDQIVLRNNKPVAAVVSIARLEQFQQLQDDLLDVSLVAARMLTAGPERVSLDDVLARFGYTREQLAELPE
ncbi:MAG: type II toxin-antitoxin system Phd/YefM family antitoxin [Chloroflexota bacterium]|nr:type II toxin-antitoxin system Phd/YefM family antitoxin [Chloroflexia bacterium]MDQ3466911.1 type II toxin-antitoxin system Phd/YefM family antitoxin [Chloroflexota bacterium]